MQLFQRLNSGAGLAMLLATASTPWADANTTVADYRFDQSADFTAATGDTITDSSGNKRHGTEGSNITWNSDGVRGGAITTSAATNGPFFSTTFPPGLIAGNSFTISFWVKTGATGSTDNYKDWGRLDFSDGTTTQHVQLRSLPVAAPDNGGFYFRDPAYTFWPTNPAVNLKNNAWHMVTATVDGTTLTLYTDGANPVVFTNYPRGAGFSLIGLRIGNGNNTGVSAVGTVSLAGLLDEVRLYGGPLSAAEVAQLYSATLAGDTHFEWQPATTGNGWLDAANWTGGDPPRAPGTVGDPLDPNSDLAVIGSFAFDPAAGLGIDMDTAGGALALGAIWSKPTGPHELRIGNPATAPGLLRLNGQSVSGEANTVLRVDGAADFALDGNVSLGLGQATNLIHVAAGRTAIIGADIIPSNPSASLVLDGGGTLVLTGDNRYLEGTILRGGTLEVSKISDSAPSQMGLTGGSNSRLSIVGGTLRFTGSGAQSTNRRLWADSGSATIEITDPTATLTLNPAAGTRSRPFAKQGSGTLVMNGTFSSAAALDVAAGKLVLGTANNHTGTTRVAAGAMIEAASPLALQLSGLTLDAEGLARFTAAPPQSTPLGSLAGAGVLDAAGHHLVVGSDGRNSRFNGEITAASLTKAGSGLMLLDATGGIGALNLAGGTLALGSNPAFSSHSITLQHGALRLLEGGVTDRSIVLEGDAAQVSIELGVDLEYLVVGGGGGGGGRDSSGGGGGGGVLTNVGSTGPEGCLAGASFEVRVGEGGAGGTNTTRGGNGKISVLGPVTALGGGAGAPYNGPAGSGASGGGGGREGTAVPGGSGTPGQGCNGGAGSNGNNAAADSGGGGGGAGEPGGNALKSIAGGKGGDGLQIDIDGSPKFFGGGGGGTPHRSTPALPSGAGGLGGGGAGAQPFGTVQPGQPNTGGGGGASRSDQTANWTGGDGGSGLVVVRYPGAPRASGGTISAGSGSAAGHALHAFTEPGNHTLDFALQQTLAAPLSGPGGFTLASTGTLILAANNTYLGETIISAGTLQIGADGTTGSPGAGPLTNLATLVFRRSDDFALSQPLHGDGLLIKQGPATLTLGATNTHTGNVRIDEGTLALAEAASLTFRIGRHRDNTRITGSGNGAFDGAFHLLLTDGPPRVHGSTWQLADLPAAVFGPGFAMTSDLGAFTRTGTSHTLVSGGQHWVFSETTGTLTLSAPPADTFTAWIDGFFPGEIAGHITGPRADPDGDGLANVVEMVLATHPGDAGHANMLPTQQHVSNPPGLPAGDYLQFSFRRSAVSLEAGVVAGVEFSADLEQWQNATPGENGVVFLTTENGYAPGVDRIDAYLPAGGWPRLFARLAATDTRPPDDPARQPLTLDFGVITDVHFGYFPNASAYLTEFVDDMHAWDPDFIIQLGDFCRPEAASNNFMGIYNSWPGPKYHVIGNHERDGGYSFQQAADYWGMPARYHTFDQGPVRGIVMDGNEPGGTGTGYAAFVGQTQQNWLAQQLAATDRPVIIFIHQPVEFLQNGADVRAIIEAAENARPGTVMAVISGHLHRDYLRTFNNIPYLQLNSATYFYYNGRVDYSAPLWARIALDFETREMRVTGREAAWAGSDPWQLGAPESTHPRDEVRPAISDRILTIREESAAMAYEAGQTANP